MKTFPNDDPPVTRGFSSFAELESEADFVESIRQRKGRVMPQGDAYLLSNLPVHGVSVLYVYDPESGDLVGQQWIVNLERPDRGRPHPGDNPGDKSPKPIEETA